MCENISKAPDSGRRKILSSGIQTGQPGSERYSDPEKSASGCTYCQEYQGAGEELDDLISIGTIGLIKAIQTFDFQKASRLSTYAARCIDNELLMLLRSKKKSSKEVSLYEPIGTDKEGTRSAFWT